MLSRFLLTLKMRLLPDPHKLLQPTEERGTALGAHRYKNGLNVSFKTLLHFSAHSAASVSQFHEDLAAIPLIAAAFYQPTFFQAIDRAHHRRRIKAQFSGNRTDRVWFTLPCPFHQPHHQ